VRAVDQESGSPVRSIPKEIIVSWSDDVRKK